MSKDVNLEKYSVDELKKLKNSLENNQKDNFSISERIAKKKLNLLDEFTSIDDLLKINIQDQKDLIIEQRETNRQLQISNKLLLALYVEEAEDGTFVPKGTTGLDTSAILREISAGGARITRVLTLLGKTIDGNLLIFNEEFEGAIVEVLFVSSTSTTDNANYSVRITSDNNVIYQDSYTSFATRSNYETDMAAFEDAINSLYLMQFQNIFFSNKILIEVYDSSATFERIYIKYHRSV